MTLARTLRIAAGCKAKAEGAASDNSLLGEPPYQQVPLCSLHSGALGSTVVRR